MKGKGRRPNGDGHVAKKADKAGLYRGYISLGYTPDGKPARRWVYGHSPQEVAAALTRLKRDLQQGVPVHSKSSNTGQFIKDWFANVAPLTLSPSTVERYEVVIRTYILPALSRYTLEELTPAHVQTLVASQVGRGLSIGYIRYTVAVLSGALQCALKWGLVQRNVARLVQIPRDPKDKAGERRRNKRLTPEQVKTFLQSIREHRLYALYLLDTATGLRRGELCALHWKDVDIDSAPDRCFLRVNYSIQRIGRELVMDAPKTRLSKRVMFLTPTVIDALRKHRDVQEIERQIAGDKWREEGFVFTTKYGAPIEPNNVLRTLGRLLKKAGLPHVPVHGLRHTFGSVALDAGADLKEVSAAMGHSKIATTADLYIEVYDAGRRRVADAMEGVISGEK